ncbi:MAG: DUF167 domain-containing protein [Pararhodobacter sp.]|nr:DUF167 domain-containing protein [Pararhodobacter sp.]
MTRKGLPDLSALAVPGARIAVRATPRARRNALEPGNPIRIHVTDPPEDGRANAAVRAILARALGVAPTRLTLLRGAAARDKLFQLDGLPGNGPPLRR